MYELQIDGRRDEPQPKVVLIESKLKRHHLLHWICPGPPASVTFQVRHSCTTWIVLYNKLILGISGVQFKHTSNQHQQ